MSRKSYDSVREVRFFCRTGLPTIEGSTSISEQPILTEEQQEQMFAIRNDNGFYQTKDPDEFCNAWDIDRIKWYSHYLEAEEKSYKLGCASIGCLSVMREALAVKDVSIRKLVDDNTRFRESNEMASRLIDSKQEQIDRLVNEVQSMRPYRDGLSNVEHADESQNNS